MDEKPLGNNALRDVIEAWKRLNPQDARTKQSMLKSLGYEISNLTEPDPTEHLGKRKNLHSHEPLKSRRDVSGFGQSESIPTTENHDSNKVEWEQPSPNRANNELQESARYKDENWLATTTKEGAPTELNPLLLSAILIEGPHQVQQSPFQPPGRENPLLSHQNLVSPPDLVPLFKSNLHRSIYVQLMAMQVPEGEMDVRELALRVAQKKALHRVPRFSVASIARGGQILIDRSNSMLPYVQDTLVAASLIKSIFGSDSIRVLHFANSPMRGTGNGLRRHWQPYPDAWSPLERTRVLVITDLGIGDDRGGLPSTPEEWLEFARFVSRRDCLLTILTPYGPDRWPPVLAQRLKIIHWDPSTTASIVSYHTKAR